MLLYLYQNSFVDLSSLKDEVISIKWDYTVDEFFRSNTKNLEDFSKIIIEESFINFDNYDGQLSIEKIIVIASDVNYQKLYHLGVKAIASLEDPIVTLTNILYVGKINIIDIQEDEIFKLDKLELKKSQLKEENNPTNQIEKIKTKKNLKHSKIMSEDILKKDEKKLINNDPPKEELIEEVFQEENKHSENPKFRIITTVLVAGGLISSLLLLYISYRF